MDKPVCYSGSTHYICLVKMTCTLQYCILIPPPPQSSRLDWPWPATVNVSVSTLVK